MNKKDLSHLSEEQIYVTQKNGTETPYENKYWNHFEKGIYVDIVSGEVLFSSEHKFKSSCGWPAFFKTVGKDNIKKVIDKSLGATRVEVRSKEADSHLGHVFNDGPAPTGVRYCINSAALEFIPFKNLVSSGYEKYVDTFGSETSEVPKENLKYITMGAGCFWGVEAIFSKTYGIIDAVSGYCGGKSVDPSYEEVCSGSSGHVEVVQVTYNCEVISLHAILELFFNLHDPTTLNRQGYDVGTQYRSAIFCNTDNEIELVKEYIKKLEQSNRYEDKIVTEVERFQNFYSAEEHHQDYYDKKYDGGQGPICHWVRGE